MPDLVSHLAAAHLVRRGVEIKRKRLFHKQDYTMFYLGTILPDLFSKTFPILFQHPKIHWLFDPTHTPVSLLLLSYIIAMLSDEDHRIRFYWLLIVGAGFHLFLDMMQMHLADGSYYWFFPFSWKSFHIPIFWPSDSIIGIPFLLAAIGIVEVLFFKNRRAKNNYTT